MRGFEASGIGPGDGLEGMVEMGKDTVGRTNTAPDQAASGGVRGNPLSAAKAELKRQHPGSYKDKKKPMETREHLRHEPVKGVYGGKKEG